MKVFAILVSSLLICASAQASESRQFNLLLLVEHCRGELPEDMLPVFVQKSICKLYFQGWISGYYFGNTRGRLAGALDVLPGVRDIGDLSEEQRAIIFEEGLDKTELCMSTVEMDTIGDLFSSYMKQHPEEAKSKDPLMLQLVTQSFIMEEFKCN